MQYEEMSDRERERFVALHRHWVAADAVSYHLRRSDRSSEIEVANLPEALDVMAKELSKFLVLGVWYGLLYVVIEGYGTLGFCDEPVNAVLENKQMVSMLRRFRNATFHFQPEVVSSKLLDFLIAESSETWVCELNRAFRDFFEKVGQLSQLLDAVQAVGRKG